MYNETEEVKRLNSSWQSDKRWEGITRSYTAEDVVKLRPQIVVDHSIANVTSRKLWDKLTQGPYINTFGALTGAQAVQMAKAGLDAIYLSGWQVAADGNTSGKTYPDQSLYPVDSVPRLVKRLNNALLRSSQVEKLVAGETAKDFMLPIVADAEAGFGGALNAFELMTGMIESGAAGVHFEDQLASEKKCGHLGGKVLVPTSQFVRTLKSARLAADVANVPSVIIARTDAQSAKLMTSDIDPADHPFITGERSPEGYYYVTGGIESCIARGLAYAPYADLIWFETSTPDLDDAKEFAKKIHEKFPGKMLAYNCSPSFNWSKHLDKATIAKFQRELGELGYRFQFITLAGWHLINYHTYDLAKNYKEAGMTAYVELQDQEFASESKGYTATKHQTEVGTGYFDKVLNTITGGNSATGAMEDSTETAQFINTAMPGDASANKTLN
jgi:isocitrate lyase